VIIFKANDEMRMRRKMIAFGLVLLFFLSATMGMAFALSNSGGGDWKY